MGLKDFMMKRFMASAPDHGAVIQGRLGDGDRVEGYAFALPVAYERSGGGVGGGKALTRMANAATNVVSQERHIGGEPGSIARSMTLEPQHVALTISERALTAWDFGMQFVDEDPREVLRIERDRLRSIERTGKKRQGGQVEVRLTFVDDSFADWALNDHESFNRGFWEAAAAFPPAAS
jgi:hypothetical protein